MQWIQPHPLETFLGTKFGQTCANVIKIWEKSKSDIPKNIGSPAVMSNLEPILWTDAWPSGYSARRQVWFPGRVEPNKHTAMFSKQLACLHDQNRSGFFGGPAFIQPIRAIWKVFKKPGLAGKKRPFKKATFVWSLKQTI